MPGAVCHWAAVDEVAIKAFPADGAVDAEMATVVVAVRSPSAVTVFDESVIVLFVRVFVDPVDNISSVAVGNVRVPVLIIVPCDDISNSDVVARFLNVLDAIEIAPCIYR